MGAAPYSAGAEEVLNGIAAAVNNEIIPYSQVRELVELKEKQARDTLKGMELVMKIKELRATTISELIDRSLILQDARAQGLAIPASAVDERIESIIGTQFGGDRASFLKFLAARGYTLAKFRDLQRDNLAIEKMREAATAGATSFEEAKRHEQEWLRALHQNADIKIY